MLLEGLKLTVKNLKIMLFPIVALIVIYLLIAGAVFTIVPMSQISQIYKSKNISVNGNMSNEIKKFEKVIYTNIQKNMKKSILVFLMFGLLAFFISEYLTASFVVASRDVVTKGFFSFRSALDEGILFTPQIIVIDILCGFGLASFIIPFYIIYYVTNIKDILFVIPFVMLFVLPLLIMPRYILVVKKSSAINSVVDGFKVALRNYHLALFSVLVFVSLVTLLSFTGIILLLIGSFSYSLMSIWMCQIAVEDLKKDLKDFIDTEKEVGL